ncbi:hypothetical protein C2R22_05785 [Salinigranum rubrum]|uniref:YdbS-like PH domain-containing protein n=1 Tax=Salinigranum rubrum TaxID=755307 RepID=A0A2I8VH28_9EURY|nr:PH domain-containing protein [Salinigranum rubrum]AUV81228.1 hypothetical protein C2R22_05785 [Salinigranum rubrum]
MSDSEATLTQQVSGIDLFEDEELLHDLRPSWANWWKSLVLYSVLSLFTLGLTLPFFAIPYLQRKNTRYIVTNERVVKRSGLFSTSTSEYRITDIREIHTAASWGERMMNVGTVRLSTDPRDSNLTLGGISDHNDVARSIRSAQR